MSPISFIFGVPVGLRMILTISHAANASVSTPATGTIQKIGGICIMVPPYSINYGHAAKQRIPTKSGILPALTTKVKLNLVRRNT
jgi:hypothetical protein